MKSTLLLVVILYITTTYAVEDVYTIGSKFLNPCISKTTCHECIQTPTCGWCSDPNVQTTQRCFQIGSMSNSCGEEFVWYPDNEMRQIKRLDLSLPRFISEVGTSDGFSSSFSSSRASEIVQVTPQHIQLKLRINEPYRFSMYYGQTEDFPVDLYFLVDHRKSMIDDKYAVTRLADLLVDSMPNISTNFRIGFGSFISEAPCENCEAPHEFRNHMSLSTDSNEFLRMVENTSVSENLDAPKGGSDAIMQAIVCRNEIGWRIDARKIIVFVSDAGFNSAKAEKFGGIITPNDGLCHLNGNGYYTHSNVQDHPSISQISQNINENQINIIFAVTEDQISNYRRVKQHIPGASLVKLSTDSSNVVDLVNELYQQISFSVEMKDNAMSGIRVNYYSICLNGDGTPKQTNKCENMKVGDVVRFNVEIEVTACPKDPKDWRQTLQIYPVGINESLVVDLEMLCSCSCEHPGHPTYIENAKQCFRNGVYKCGICECNPNYFGKRCECFAIGIFANEEMQNCRADNVTQFDCSGRGNCICGECNCYARVNKEEVISGQFCECDNFSCDRHNGVLCSGLDHGTCDCGKCQCVSPWTGSACNCLASNDTCYPPNIENAEICSGHGECVCGQCECEKTENARYSGKYCEKCPTCPGRCSEFKECVQCQMYKTGTLTKEECAANCTFVPITVQKVEVNEEKDENLCAYYDEDDCRFEYVYYYDENNKVVIKAQEETECPPKTHYNRCSEFKYCVQCLVYKTGPLNDEDCAAYCPFVPVIVKNVQDYKDENETLCTYYDEDNCKFEFVYHYGENYRVAVKAQEERDCSQKHFEESTTQEEIEENTTTENSCNIQKESNIQKDNFDLFGELIASELRSFSESKYSHILAEVKRIIYNAINNATMEKIALDKTML